MPRSNHVFLRAVAMSMWSGLNVRYNGEKPTA